MNDQPNITYLFISKYGVTPKTSGTIETYADMTDGAIAVCSEANVAVSSVASLSRFKIAHRIGDSLVFSPLIDRNTVTNALTINYVAPVQQITYIGYNGVSGSMSVINSNVYKARIELDGSPLKQFGNKRMMKFGVYKSDATATEAEIAHGFLNNLMVNFADETLAHLHFSLVNSFTVTAGDKLDYNLAVVQGLNTVTEATNPLYSSGESVAVGQYLRIGTVGGGTALTSSVYKITGISGAIFTLDRPVVEASGTYAAATADAEIIRVANIGNFGIKVTGQANPFFVGKWKFFVTTFTIDLQDFGSTLVTYSTTAVQGIGYGAQVQEEEYLLQGNWGNKYRGVLPENGFPFFKEAVATTEYNYLTFNFRLDGGEQLGYRISQPGTIKIAVGNDASEDCAVAHVFHQDTTYFANAIDFV